MATSVTEPKGAVLFRRGEPAFGIFLLVRGSVVLRLETDEGIPVLDRTATRHSIVGLPASMAGGRYSLTAVTLKESQLAFVDRQALLDRIKDDPALGLELVRALGEEVLQMRMMLAPAPSSE